MAILRNNGEDGSPDLKSVVLERLSDLEKSLDDLRLAHEETNVHLLMQSLQNEASIRFGSPTTLATNTRLIFKHPDIDASEVLRGSVNDCFRDIIGQLEHSSSIDYFGSTSDPDRRIREHLRKMNTGSMGTLGTLHPMQMRILYHTTRMEKAADLESRLLLRYKLTRNVSTVSNGLIFGKPSYFVYLLRRLPCGLV